MCEEESMIDFKELWGAADWIVLAAYFVGVMSVGFVMHRKASKNFKRKCFPKIYSL